MLCEVCKKSIIILGIALCFITSACTSQEKKKFKEDKRTSETLVIEIENELNQGNFNKAIMLIDSLNSAYPEQTNARRTTLLSRARAMEGLIRDSIYIIDCQIVENQLEIDSLKTFFKGVEEKNLPGYIIDKSVSDINILSGNVVQPRLGDSLSPWVLEVSVKGNVGINGFKTDINNNHIVVRAKNASSRLVSGTNVDMMSFSCDELEEFASNLDGRATEDLKIIVTGNKKNTEITIPAKTLNAIWRTYRFAKLRDLNNITKAKRELLERKLIVAQNQIANFDNI